MNTLEIEKDKIREAYVRAEDPSTLDEELLRARFDLWFAREIAAAIEAERRAIEEMRY